MLLDQMHEWLYATTVRTVRIIAHLGNKMKCPVCGHTSRKFMDARRQPNSRCIWCGSLVRHRLMWLFIQRNTDLFNGQPKRMLHFAPEPAFIKPLRRELRDGYITADLYEDAMVKVDVTNIQFLSNSFDVIFCSHVLEHVEDDLRAIRELVRVLKSDGWTIIMLPINAEKTFEDKTVKTPEERERVFGQADHVRICGTDYRERLEDQGLHVHEYGMNDFTTPEEQKRFGLRDEPLYFCTKSI
jgi:SAM-dependent methyltransferase